MKTKTSFIIVIMILLSSQDIFAQVENVPLTSPVYDFLKEMRVKRIIPKLNDDDPNLSRFQVANHLKQIQLKLSELSSTEKKLLKKYK